MEKNHKDCSVKVDELVEKHTWIASEKQLFGKRGTNYDFESCDPFVAREKLEKAPVRSIKVDAALDLSHTENIGRMIKPHFPHSQVEISNLNPRCC
ncbi:unnamed protein product [Arabis nemorensis]|uniref:Uncharacterized protein n=1 Tax=Arabis nemorensis TaxID=586526 RepID=A0A565B1Z8_9BRAS|nr:unnamed protein product [Arabis nemorensis]